MTIEKRIKDFEKLGFGLFVHFGLYSVVGRGEWIADIEKIPFDEYRKLTKKFDTSKNWAKELVKTAVSTGCKYITLTTRHHDGFSLFDTCGLNDFDAPHSACGRDLIAEFVSECNLAGIVPFFYHTLLDWYHPSYNTDFPAYVDYLIDSVEILCKNYGKIGGIWFDGMWNKPSENWQEDRLYQMIHKHQPQAMIINNTGLSEIGKVGHPEIDSVTFERGKPTFVDNSDRARAGEMCQVLNDHWGYAEEDCNYKSVKELVENLVDCRRHNCNFLLNTGLRGDGTVNDTDRVLLGEVGKWVKANKECVFDVKASEIQAHNAYVLKGEHCYYAVVKDVAMQTDPNVGLAGVIKEITLKTDKKIKNAVWLDTGTAITVDSNRFKAEPFSYGVSRSVRVARIAFD